MAANEFKCSLDYLTDKSVNKFTTFTLKERDGLGLEGLLSYHKSNMDSQVGQIIENLRREGYGIIKYILLNALKDSNERPFYRILMDNIDEVLPLVYAPRVGQACKEFLHFLR